MASIWQAIRNLVFPPELPPVEEEDISVPPKSPVAAAQKIIEPSLPFPKTFAHTAVPGALQPTVFDPALKQFGRAFRHGEPQFADAEIAAQWFQARRFVVSHILRTISSESQWSRHLVLRGSQLLPAWLGDEAREPGDIDWVVTPESMTMNSREGESLLAGLIQLLKSKPGANVPYLCLDQIVTDDIWTYDRVPGRRIVIPWNSNYPLPQGNVQMDFVFGEVLFEPPVVTNVPGVWGTIPVRSASKELSLAWKLLWLETDMHAQGKDLYDAVLLAEQMTLPRDLLHRVLEANWAGSAQKLTPDFPRRWSIDWEVFQQEYPHVHGTAEEWQERLVRALEPMFR